MVFAQYSKMFILLYGLLALNPLSSMTKEGSEKAEGYQEVFSDNTLHQQFENKRFLLIEGIINKEPAKVEQLLHSCTPKVAMALANMLYQNIAYTIFSGAHNKGSLTPLSRTIRSFFSHLTIYEQRDLDCVTPVALSTFLGDSDTIVRLLAHGADINGFYGPKGYPPLHLAAKYQPDLIPFLIARGANVEARDGCGDTALMVACKKDGKFEALAPLIAARASLTATIPHESAFLLESKVFTATPLHSACNNRQVEKVRFLLQNGAPVDEPDIQGKTPLHCTVANRHHGIALILLEHGADITRRTADGKSLIEQINGDKRYRYDGLLDLLRYGAPYPHSRYHRQMIAAELSNNYGLRHSSFLQKFIQALLQNDPHEVQQLLSRASGNQLNETDDHKMTPLLWAVCRGNVQATARILECLHRSPIDLQRRDQNGYTALDWARWLQRDDIAELLQKAGA